MCILCNGEKWKTTQQQHPSIEKGRIIIFLCVLYVFVLCCVCHSSSSSTAIAQCSLSPSSLGELIYLFVRACTRESRNP